MFHPQRDEKNIPHPCFRPSAHSDFEFIFALGASGTISTLEMSQMVETLISDLVLIVN